MTTVNIGHLCTRAQCENGLADKTAMRWLDAALHRTDYRFADLEAVSNAFANVLSDLGQSEGDVVFTCLHKCPEQFFCYLGALKKKCITGALFASFGEDGLRDRLGDAGAKVLVTRRSLLKKLARIRTNLPQLRHVCLVDAPEHLEEGVWSLPRLLTGASTDFTSPDTDADTPAILHYTSGSTGKPKGVLHRHGALEAHRRTTRDILGVGPDDLFWCTADQGWVTGISYGVTGPWSQGVTQLHFAGGYDAEKWFEALEREKVSVWYTAPTALRMLMREDRSLYARFDLSHLRHLSSVGEPLNPEVIRWVRDVLGKTVHDTWFQTETGSILIANRPGMEVRPGSMGKPVDGVEAAILSDSGEAVPTGESGHLCIRDGWTSRFVGYLNQEEAYRSRFRNGFYYTGDTASLDADGYFWFYGRSDDVINTAGHLVSPFEVESALIEVPGVAEAGVIGAPDDLLYEKIVAFVSLHADAEWNLEIELKLRLHVANRVSSIATPQEILPCRDLPRNRSGKILRRVLKARYLGTDEGDTSTMG